MEKKLKLTKQGENYRLVSDDSKVEIKIENLKIDAKDIYNQLIKDSATTDESYKFEIMTELTEKDDNRILKQIQTLFSKIEDALNQIKNK